MADTRTVFAYATGQFAKLVADLQRPLAVASMATIRQAADRLKTEARADIAAAGFSKRWQNALRVNVYPSGNKASMGAAAFLFHRIPYADVFETGASIRGHPFLWLPLKNTPKKIGGKKITPALYQQAIGPLRYVAQPGKPPLLFAEQAATRSKKTTLSIASLKRGAAGSGVTRSVPLFIGIPVAKIGKRFHIKEDAARVQGLLPGLFAANFKPET